MNPSARSAGIVESALKKLAAIGPRPHGSSANENALDYVSDSLATMGMTIVVEDFVAPIPQTRAAARLFIDDVALPCVPFLESVSGRVEGRLDQAANCLIWGMHDCELWMVQGSQGTGAIAIPPFPQAVQQHIPPELVAIPSVLVARDDLEASQMSRAGLPARLEVTTALREGMGRCLRAFRGSADPLASPDKAPHPIVVAHIDTVPDSPGVYDNAAGVAAAMSLCSDPLAHDFELLITSGEEVGLAGARAFTQHLVDAGRASTLSMAIVLDGGGRGRTVEAWLSPDLNRNAVERRLQTVAGSHGYRNESRQPAPPASDHAAFIEAEVPSVMFTVNDLEILHTPDDTYEQSKLDSSRLLAAVAFDLLTLPNSRSLISGTP